MDDRTFNSLLFGGIPLVSSGLVTWLSWTYEDPARRFLPLQPLEGARAWLFEYPGILILTLLLSFLPALAALGFRIPRRTILIAWALALPVALLALRIALGLL